MTARHGVVVMAYGSPRRREEIADYYTDIRRGLPPSAEQLADLTRRYDAIGGLSPLTQRTEAQRAAIAAALEQRFGARFVVEVGLRHAEPTIEDAVDRLAADGVDGIVGIVLAPHYSTISVAAYLERADKQASTHELSFTGIESWATEPAYVDYLARAVSGALQELPTTRTCCSPPTHCRGGSSRRAIRTRPRWQRRPASSPNAVA